VQANIIYKQREHGISILQATVRLNQFCETLTPPTDPVSWSCVRRFVCESLVIRSHRRQTKNAGDFSPTSGWAVARWHIAVQILAQLIPGARHPSQPVPGHP
jgi:hypothetical protein